MVRSYLRNATKYMNSDIAVLAVYQLGGALHLTHLEDVAMKAAELSPKSFSESPTGTTTEGMDC